MNTWADQAKKFRKRPLNLKATMPDAEDPVHNPTHYNRKGIECIDAIEASMSAEEFLGYLKGNNEKYMWRYRYKGKPLEDLKKARWYLDKLIEKTLDNPPDPWYNSV